MATQAHRSLPRMLSMLVIAAMLIAGLAPTSTAQAQSRGLLSKHARELIATARVNGETTVTLLVAAQRGRNASAARDISALGASIHYREDDIDYLRVVTPINQAAAIAALPSVEAVEVNEVIPLEDPTPDGVSPLIPQPVPGASTPNNNPYMPIGDTGASDFMTANPTWDGRGVVVGIVDTGITLDHPSLLTTSTGERKVIDWVTGTNPFDDDDPTWLNMATQVSGASFVHQQVTYTAPAAATYRIGLFNERDPRLGGELENDVNRDGNPNGSSGIFAVLWDTAANKVYVDTNQNNNFADDMAMTDYKVNYDVNYFGTDNPATAVAERMPFVVQTDGQKKVVNIGIVSGAHGSHVAGIVGGNSLFGGAMSGAAPGVKFVSVRACLFIAGCTNAAMTEGMIYAAKQSNVDVINMSIGGLPALNDGNNARALLYNRLIEQYSVQMFFSAGNSGPGINTIGDPSVATQVMSVGSYITDATYLANYGVNLSSPGGENIHFYSSRGPREDGGFKPNIVAPGAAISTVPIWQTAAVSGGCLAQTCPIGYAMFNGTSMAAPQAAGAAALLVSAAKQANVQHQPAQLRQALNSSARFMSDTPYTAVDQGNGLIQVGAAWNLLKTNIKTSDISASVPVNTILSGFLDTPGVGTGIYDREGVKPGDSYSRTYTFVRSKGSSQAVNYAISWVDNDGTFSSATSISLPRGRAVTLPVTIHPATAGIHAAIMNVDDPSTAGIDFQTMNAVIAADQFAAANNYSVTKTGTLKPAHADHHFFFVPAGTPALKVDMVGGGAAGAGAIRFLRWHPYGLGIDSNASSNCYNGAPGGCTTGSPTSRTTTNPQAGVWEVSVDARRNSDADAPYTLTVSILGASVSISPNPISAAVGSITPIQASMTNLFGAFTGRAVGGGSLGSALRATPTIADLEQQQKLVTVSPNSSSLRATIGGTSDPAADLDLFVFNCTTGSCVLAGQSADGDSEESVTIANPAAGDWVVLVDGFAVPAGTTTYNYIDVFANAAFGSVAVTDANAVRAAGANWTAPGTVTVSAAPAAGRVLLGAVQVRTDTNVLVGQGEVTINVTP